MPGRLRPLSRLREESAVKSRRFFFRKVKDPKTLAKWLINDLGWDHISEHIKLGTTEVWSFVNPSGEMHPIHLHLVQFQILDRQPFDLAQFKKTGKV
ncbi:MAG: multicopper oxidase domain-containing protein, partial [Deltaproteobacteria bacterium]|nr:multicopper oxidase domain-containing protein [Deltaproteobacteria bacterium]